MKEKVVKSYKWCCVPLCFNTTKNTPHKIFIHVPKCEEKRKLWCEAARRTLPKPKSNLFCCEDHFDLEKDVANYMYQKQMGGRIYMKPSVVPHKFHCQPSWRHMQRKKICKSLTLTEVSVPSVSSKIAPEALTSLPPVVTVVEDSRFPSSVKIEEPLEDPLLNVAEHRTTSHVDVGIQVNIRPKYRSKSTYCNI